MKDIFLKLMFKILKNYITFTIKFNQKVWLKQYITINTELRKNDKKIISKKLFQVDE